jgi:hypothetical protein
MQRRFDGYTALCPNLDHYLASVDRILIFFTGKFTLGNVKSSRLSYSFVESLPLLSISRWRSRYGADRGVSLISKQQNSWNKCILSDETRWSCLFVSVFVRLLDFADSLGFTALHSPFGTEVRFLTFFYTGYVMLANCVTVGKHRVEKKFCICCPSQDTHFQRHVGGLLYVQWFEVRDDQGLTLTVVRSPGTNKNRIWTSKRLAILVRSDKWKKPNTHQ